MMSEGRHLAWERFEELVKAGPPAVERVGGTPDVDIFTDAAGVRIGVRIPADPAGIPPSPLVEIDVRTCRVDGIDVIEVATVNRALYRDFYSFACAVADRIQIDRIPSAAAVDSALDAWAALLQRLALLSDERQAGLWGELWMLRRLADSVGWSTAVEAWKGSDAEEHDFSWVPADVEVKTTLSERRIHMIGSLTQLVPTGGRPLHILSIQLTGAGAGPGESLAECVAEVLRLVGDEGADAKRRLDARLESSGWRESHAAHYRRRFALRTPPTLVPVDDTCPSITPDLLQPLGAERLARVAQVAYRVDLNGLGSEDGTPEFLALLPRGTM